MAAVSDEPKPDKVSAYTEDLISRYGQDAFRTNGDAMVAAREAKEFRRYRFLKEVSGELVSRLFGKPTASDGRPAPTVPQRRCVSPVLP